MTIITIEKNTEASLIPLLQKDENGVPVSVAFYSKEKDDTICPIVKEDILFSMSIAAFMDMMASAIPIHSEILEYKDGIFYEVWDKLQDNKRCQTCLHKELKSLDDWCYIFKEKPECIFDCRHWQKV